MDIEYVVDIVTGKGLSSIIPRIIYPLSLHLVYILLSKIIPKKTKNIVLEKYKNTQINMTFLLKSFKQTDVWTYPTCTVAKVLNINLPLSQY